MHEIDIATVDLNLLAVFEVLDAERHVGRAAQRLHLSQSATSHALGRLRTLFDDPLFVRHPRGIEPTPRARELALPIADALADIRRVLRPAPAFEPAALKRDFRIATHDYAMVVLIAPLVARLRDEAPGVNLRCVTLPKSKVVDALDRGDIDVALGGFVGMSVDRIRRIELFRDRFVGVARADHPLARRRRPGVKAFASYPQVLVGSGGEARGEIDEALAVAGVERRAAVTTASFLSVPAIVATSDLVGVLPERLAQRLCTAPTFRVFPLPVPIAPVTCSGLLPEPLATRPEMIWLIAQMKRAVASAI